MVDNLREQFNCPACHESGQLEVVIDGAILSHQIDLAEDGYFEHREGCDVDVHEGWTNRFQCSVCGYTLTNEAGETITEGEDVVEWIKAHS
jgi:predicted nucleic-acid-binding Zn-ribbon protein